MSIARKELQFLSDVIKPWDDLNRLLVQNYAFQTDISDVTRQAFALAVCLKHQIDLFKSNSSRSDLIALQKEVDNNSDSVRLMSDIADTYKHRDLSNKDRITKLFIAALFETNEHSTFCFLRNTIFAEHPVLHRRDFMEDARAAILFWIKKHALDISWNNSILSAPPEFHPTAALNYNPQYCIQMENVRTMFFKRDPSGALHPYNPPEVRFAIF